MRSAARDLALIGLLLLTVARPMPLEAQQSAEELAKAAQNPVANLVSLPFQNNFNFEVDPKGQTQNVLNIQPVVPFVLNADWNLMTRTVVPVISQPDFCMSGGGHSGIGDIQFSAFLFPGRPTSSGWIWGVGAIALLPTADSKVLGQGKRSLGPPAVAARLINNVWSVGGDDARPDVNQMLIQPFVNCSVPGHPGFYIGSSPMITADWKSNGRNVWTVPSVWASARFSALVACR